MKDNVKKAFQAWVSSVNWQMPHALDNQRFMDFIILTVNNGEKTLDEAEFKKLCTPYQKDQDRIDFHYSRYDFGIDLLKHSKSK